MEKEALKEFFAVTMTSIYHVKDDVDGAPEVKKIALRGESIRAVGSIVSGPNGGRGLTMVSVGKHIVVFIPEGHSWLSARSTFVTQLENVNTMWWGGNTSEVVALFLKETDAMECFNASELKPRDARWQKNTLETLRAIGREHPRFSITTWHNLRLMDPSEVWPVTENKTAP